MSAILASSSYCTLSTQILGCRLIPLKSPLRCPALLNTPQLAWHHHLRNSFPISSYPFLPRQSFRLRSAIYDTSRRHHSQDTGWYLHPAEMPSIPQPEPVMIPRPESVMSLRPMSISQPNIPSAIDLNNVPSELQLVLGLISLQTQRPYCDGYVLRKHLNLPGTPPNPFSCNPSLVLRANRLRSRRKTRSRSRMVWIFRTIERHNTLPMGRSTSRPSRFRRNFSICNASIHQHHRFANPYSSTIWTHRRPSLCAVSYNSRCKSLFVWVPE